jgi:hypothetical protein
VEADVPNMAIPVEVSATKVLVARYIYLGGVVPGAHTLVVRERNPAAVEWEPGSIGFDFTTIYRFVCEGDLVFQHLVHDEETYYWGRELSLDEVTRTPSYRRLLEEASPVRFVLTEWGGVLPLKDWEIAIPRPEMFELPSDLRG